MGQRMDLQRLGQLMLALEDLVHAGAWGEAPAVWLLHDTTHIAADQQLRHILGGGPWVSGDRYAARGLFRLNVGRSPWEALRTFAANIAYAPTDHPQAAAVRKPLQLPGALALGVTVRRWARLVPVGHAPWHNGEILEPAPVPGSREKHELLVVDRSLRTHVVERYIGGQPRLDTCVSERGDYSTSLRIIIDYLNGRRPPRTDEEFARRYPSLQQMGIVDH